MRKVLVALAGVLALLVLAGCDDSKPQGVTLGDEQPVVSKVDVDTPDLQALRTRTGMDACAPGPGGGALPDVTLPCLGGGPAVALSSLKGPMLINFWGGWCGPCQEEMPILQQFYADHGQQVPLLGIDWQDQRPADALRKIEQRGVTYPSLADPSGETQQYAEFAKIVGMPTTFFVDADGKIAYVHVGQVHSESELTDLVREHLGVAL